MLSYPHGYNILACYIWESDATGSNSQYSTVGSVRTRPPHTATHPAKLNNPRTQPSLH